VDAARAYERSLSPAKRRAGGVHYTPPDAADELVALALDGLRAAPMVCDPACGGGAFLLAAARALERRGLARRTIVEKHLWGADVDVAAVGIATKQLAEWAGGAPAHVVVGDPLLDGASAWPCGAPAFDAVVGNPPFLNQLERATVRGRDLTAALAARFSVRVVRPYTDTAWLFLLAACQLARPGGRVALIQPQSLLASRDAAPIRRAVADQGAIVALWTDGGRRLFDASVEVCAPVIALGAAGGDHEWAGLLADATGVPPVELRGEGKVGDVAIALAGFRDEYYGLVPFVGEAADLVRSAPLVTSGLIDLGTCAWGERPARFAKRRWQAPAVDLDTVAADPQAAAWVTRQRVPKVVLATQTRVMEAAVDADGSWIASVPTIAVVAPADQLWALAATLCAPAISAWALRRTAGSALSAGAIKLSASAVLDIPLPADRVAWSRGTELLAAGELDAFGAAMGDAYGIDDDGNLLAWWRARAQPRH
jgi:hypothetical protein